MKNYFKLIALFLLLAFSGVLRANAQTIIQKYYDSNWFETSKQSAFYIRQYRKIEDIYLCTSYWAKSNLVCGVSARADTFYSSGKLGLSKEFYENGQTSDSSFFDSEHQQVFAYDFYEIGKLKDSVFFDSGKAELAHHYYPDGSTFVNYSRNRNTSEESIEAFDEKANRIENFVYKKEAQFAGGQMAWRSFLKKRLNALTPMNQDAPSGNYTVLAEFIVQKDGTVADLKAITNLGYGMETEVLRILKKSRDWIPEIYLNIPRDSYKIQPVTFSVAND